MDNHSQVVATAYRKTFNTLEKRCRAEDLKGIIALLRPVQGRPGKHLIELDLGIPWSQRELFRPQIRQYQEEYEEYASGDYGIYHLSQLIMRIFREIFPEVRESTFEYIVGEKEFLGLEKLMETKLDRATARERSPERQAYFQHIKAQLVDLSTRANAVLEMFLEKPFADFTAEERKPVGRLNLDITKFAQSRDARQHLLPEIDKWVRQYRTLGKLLLDSGQRIRKNYDDVSKTLPLRAKRFSKRLEEIAECLGGSYTLTPQTRFISKASLKQFADLYHVHVGPLLRERGKFPAKFIIMPCTTYRTVVHWQLYFDRNNVLQINPRFHDGGEESQNREIEIETDVYTKGDMIFFSITADVNNYQLDLEGRELKGRTKNVWPPISCVLRMMGQCIWTDLFKQKGSNTGYDPLGLYDRDGSFVGPYRQHHMSDEPVPKPGTFSAQMLAYYRMLQNDKSRRDELIERFGGYTPAQLDEQSWREIGGGECIGLSLLSKIGIWLQKAETEVNFRSYYQTIGRWVLSQFNVGE